MSDEPIPEEVCKVLEDYIDSVAQLEALVLMRSSSTRWSAVSIAERLYVTEQEAERVLAHLHAHNLICFDESGYWFEPTDASLSRAASLLAQLYRTHLIPITRLIHSKPHRIQQFANAFKIKQG